MKKIAFTSCCHFGHDAEQVTWQRVGKHRPDWLFLMGDNIYMDYWPHLRNGIPLEASEFGFDMQSKYKLQFTHPSFHKLIQGGFGKAPEIMAIWDDHDFAWDNSYGEPGHCYSISTEKKILSRALFQVYREACRTRQQTWPMQNIVELLAKPLQPQGIYESKDLWVGDWHIRFIGLDGRYHRRYVEDKAGTMEELLGKTQCDFLKANLLGDTARGIARPDLAIVISGTTLQKSTPQKSESWQETYPKALDEFYELTKSHGAVIVLSGDIHENGFYPCSADNPGCIEAIASGAGIFKWGVTNMKKNYGILTLNDDHTAMIALYDRNHVNAPSGEYKINFNGNGNDDTAKLLATGGMEVTTLKHLIPSPEDEVPPGLDIRVFGS